MPLELPLEYVKKRVHCQIMYSLVLLLRLDAPLSQVEVRCRERLQEVTCLCYDFDEQRKKQISKGEGPVNDVQGARSVEAFWLDKGIPQRAEVGRIVAEQFQASAIDHAERDRGRVGAIDGTIQADPEGKAENRQR